MTQYDNISLYVITISLYGQWPFSYYNYQQALLKPRGGLCCLGYVNSQIRVKKVLFIKGKLAVYLWECPQWLLHKIFFPNVFIVKYLMSVKLRFVFPLAKIKIKNTGIIRGFQPDLGIERTLLFYNLIKCTNKIFLPVCFASIIRT